MSPEKLNIKISAVILARDEEETITGIVTGARKCADEVLVIDGHSQDLTQNRAERAGARVVLDNGKGKGDGYKVGLHEAVGEAVVFLDADGSHDPADIPKLAAPVLSGELDLVIGSRWRGGSDDIHPNFNHLVRDLGGNLLSIIISSWFKTEVTDCLHGFRAIRRSEGLKLGLEADDFDIEHEMIIKALQAGLKVGEVAVHEYARKGGKSKLPTFGKAHIFLWRLIRELSRGRG
jgi:dolichol-phosphate mannosyltransferase